MLARARSMGLSFQHGLSRTHSCALKPLGDAVETASMPGETQPHIGDRDARTSLQELGDAALSFVRPTRDYIGRRQETVDPYRRGVFGECAFEPAYRFGVPARVELRGRHPVAAQEVQSVDRSERTGDLKTFDRLGASPR